MSRDPKVITFPCARITSVGSVESDPASKRWIAEVVYRDENGGQFITHHFEEIAELHELIERGPHWDTLIRCTITLNRPAEDGLMTVEGSETI